MPRRKNSSAVSKLKTLAYRSKIGSKMSQLNTTNLFFTSREVNTIDEQKGKVQLAASHTTRNGETSGLGSEPLVVFPLKQVIQGTDVPTTCLMLEKRACGFSGLKPIEYSGQTGNSVNVASGGQFKKALLRYVDLRFMLWQQASKDIKFNMYLVKVFDEDLDPQKGIVLDGNEDNWTDEQKILVKKRRLLWYYHFLRATTSSPLIENQEGYLDPIKGKFKILWKKSYKIDELHGNLEEKHYQQVRFFKRYDEIVDFVKPDSYINNPVKLANVNTGDNNPDQVKYIEPANQVQTEPQLKHQEFLVITANCSYSENDASGTSNMDKATFDYSIKTKWTIPSGNKIFST